MPKTETRYNPCDIDSLDNYRPDNKEKINDIKRAKADITNAMFLVECAIKAFGTVLEKHGGVRADEIETAQIYWFDLEQLRDRYRPLLEELQRSIVVRG